MPVDESKVLDTVSRLRNRAYGDYVTSMIGVEVVDIRTLIEYAHESLAAKRLSKAIKNLRESLDLDEDVRTILDHLKTLGVS